MSPIPGEPLHRDDPRLDELTTKDGRKVKLKLPPGMPSCVKPAGTEERGAGEPPRDNPAPRHNPLHGGV
jgi:hypothetical protein